MKRRTMCPTWLSMVCVLVCVVPVLMFVCLTGCDLLNQMTPVPPIEFYTDRELAEELLGRGFNELEDMLGGLFDGENALRPLPQASHPGKRPRATGPGGRARSIRN